MTMQLMQLSPETWTRLLGPWRLMEYRLESIESGGLLLTRRGEKVTEIGQDVDIRDIKKMCCRHFKGELCGKERL